MPRLRLTRAAPTATDQAPEVIASDAIAGLAVADAGAAPTGPGAPDRPDPAAQAALPAPRGPVAVGPNERLWGFECWWRPDPDGAGLTEADRLELEQSRKLLRGLIRDSRRSTRPRELAAPPAPR